VSVKRFFPFILLFSAWTLLPFFDGGGGVVGIEDEVQYEVSERPVDRKALTASTFALPIALNYFKRSILAINLPGIKGTQKLPGLYHLKSSAWVPEEYEWQCGLHMLYNMCEIERTFSPDDEFIFECESVPCVFEEDGSYPADLKKIARRIAVCPLHILEYNNDVDDIDILDESAIESRFWSRIHVRLNKSGVQCEHFGCLVYAENSKNTKVTKVAKDTKDSKEWHIFLITVVKMADGTCALYLLDNMNYNVPRPVQYQMYCHAKYIHNHIFG
jgi:hypothetical protein